MYRYIAARKLSQLELIMKFKRVIFPASILSTVTLMGCNFDVDNNNNEQPQYPQTTITIMNGYLENALVCSAKNTNSCSEGQDNVIGITDSNGELIVKDTYLESPLIAKIRAGKSFDSHQMGTVKKSYTLVAPSGTTVITPFTSLVLTKHITIEKLADWLSIDSYFISGDYIALKSNDEDRYNAQKAHLLARTITELTLTDEDLLRKLGHFLANLDNKAIDLDKTEIILNEDQDFQKKVLNNNSLGSYVKDKLFYYRSLNEDHSMSNGDYKYGELEIEFVKNNKLIINGSLNSYSYTTSGSTLRVLNVGYTDTYYYANKNIALVSTSRMGLDLVTQESLSSASSVDNLDSKLQDNSWFYLSPTESFKLADITKFSFKNNKTLTIKINDDNEFEGLWVIEEHQLIITDIDHVVIYKFEFKIDDDNVLPVISTVDGENQYGLFIGTLEFAEQIKKLWNKDKRQTVHS